MATIASNIPAQSRIIIEDVQPEIDSGKFPVKRITGENFNVSCDLFADGHDVVSGRILYKKVSAKKWLEAPLNPVINDRWQGSFELSSRGEYEYTIEGWVDYALNWQHGIERKIKDNQHVNVELLDGIQYLERILKEVNKDDKDFLTNCIENFSDEEKYSVAVDYATSERLHIILHKNPKKDFKLTYERTLKILVERQKALFSSWYEFFPRSSGKNGEHGNFKTCLEVLPHVAKMGFDVLYFPPIHPIGEKHRKGKNNSVTANEGDPGSPWAIGSKDGGHDAIHSELGDLKDFKKLIDSANDLGIEIAMDLALQCAPDHPWVKEHPEWFKWRPDGSVQYAENPPKKYQDILPIYFETEDWKNLWNEILRIVLYWNKQGIKIFRVDNPHTKPFRFWEWLIKEAQKKDPDLIFLAEAFTRPKIMHELAKCGFTQSYTYFTWRNSKHELTEYINEIAHSTSREFFRPNFWPNTPDINPYFLQDGNEWAFYIRYFLAATLSSNYGMYGPVFEFIVHKPIFGKEEYLDSEKYEVKSWDWSNMTNLKRLITQLNGIRKHEKALQDTFNCRVCDTTNDQIFAYYKSDAEANNHLLMIVSLDPYQMQAGRVKTPIGEILQNGGYGLQMQDLITGQSFQWYDEWNYVEIGQPKLPFHLFRMTKL
ncbi:MAG: alpha-1,4-glucan--maltose-1-phosphate maltosyltransferase [Bacteroidota bacterium]